MQETSAHTFEMVALKRCQSYSRAEIREMLGGGIQSYLPSVGGQIVAGCFTLPLNPGAPELIYPGTGPIIERKAQQVASERIRLPIFLKRGNKAYEFVGFYRCEGISYSTQDIRRASIHSGRAEITSVLFFEPD